MEPTLLDEFGQPLNEAFQARANATNAASALRGILLGIAADRRLHPHEIVLLQGWLETQKQTGDVLDLADALTNILEDGEISKDEHDDLLEIISDCLEYGENPDSINDRTNMILGFLRGITADGEINPKEFEKLKDVVFSNVDLANQFPISAVYKLLMENQIPSIEDLKSLKNAICRLVGSDFSNDGDVEGGSTVVDSDEMPKELSGKLVCFTGKFLSGTRTEKSNQAKSRGMIVVNTIKTDLDILVVGVCQSRDWKFTNCGNKIQQAMVMKKHGKNLRIVSEDRWESCF